MIILWTMFVTTNAIFTFFSRRSNTEAVTTRDNVQDMTVLVLQKLLDDMDDGVSRLADFSGAIVNNLQLPLCEGRKLVEVFRSMIADAKLEIGTSCDLWSSQKNLVALLEMAPAFFGEGVFRLEEATSSAISELCHKQKAYRKTADKKHVEAEDLEKLRDALFRVRNGILRLERAMETLGRFLFIFHGCGGASTDVEDFTKNSYKFESACRDVYGSFGDIDLEEEGRVMFEEAQRRTESARLHVERGEKAMEAIKRLQTCAEKGKEEADVLEEELYDAFINAKHAMSFMKLEFSHISPPLLCFIANMELGKLCIRNEKLRLFGAAQSDRFL